MINLMTAIMVGTVFFGLALIFHYENDFRDKEKLMREMETHIAELSRKKASSIASLKPVELDTYLESIMVMVIQILISAYGSEKNPDLVEYVYSRSMVEFLNYLGDNVSSIEYYYGDGYVVRWFDNRFKLILIDGTLAKWIHNPLYTNNNHSVDEMMEMVTKMKEVFKP